ncbi:MAG: 30S ribosome-binding factor RbfA [Paracoccaceae bacterium]
MAKKRFNAGAGPSQRQLRVGELIRRKLSDIMLRGELHDDELAHVSVTIGEVRISPDLRNAIVFALPLGGINTDSVIEALNRNQGELRHLVTKGLKLKHAPELKFLADRSYDQMDETQRLLDSDEVRRDLDPSDDE